MRGAIPDLESPAALGRQLPVAFQGHDFTERFLSCADDSLAPIFATLDNLAAYLDPDTAPADFLAGVGTWVCASTDDRMELPQRRAAVRDAVRTHRLGGTAEGLRTVVARLTGGEVEVTESGGTVWSVTPRTPLPGRTPPSVRLVVAVTDPESVDLASVTTAARDVLPPYVDLALEVVAS